MTEKQIKELAQKIITKLNQPESCSGINVKSERAQDMADFKDKVVEEEIKKFNLLGSSVQLREFLHNNLVFVPEHFELDANK